VSVAEVRVPDLGDAKSVNVVDVLIKKGSEIRIEDPLITLESEKASMDVPSPVSGVVESVEVKAGDKVSAGALIARVQVAETVATPAAAPAPATPPSSAAAATPTTAPQPAASPTPAGAASAARAAAPAAVKAATTPADGRMAEAPTGAVDLVVIGAGVGGYTAAFRAADLGLKVTLIERWPMLGGVCLNVGCIPSKALLHAAKVIEDAADMAACGIAFGPPQIDRDCLRAWKNRVVTRLTNGLALLAKQRKVQVIQGEAKFSGPFSLEVQGTNGARRVDFKQCIIAVGSESARLPGLPDDPRVIDSSGALELPLDCKRLLVIGGGIIGLEMACVYDALGVRVTVVELSDGLMPGTDRDLVRPLQKRIEKRYERILLNTKVAKRDFRWAGCTGAADIRPGAGGRGTYRQRQRCRRGHRRRRGQPPRPHCREQADAHQCAAYLCHRRCGRPAHAGAQGLARGQGRGGSGGRTKVGIRRALHPLGGVYRSGGLGGLHLPKNRVGRRQRNRSEGKEHRLRQGPVSMGRQRPCFGAQSRRRVHQGTVRQADA
jgi:NADPH-dependent 2,4-dienoyl-CoA reductase/sulfur reductase-like enzyme